jgi:UDP-glucuronate 4-epimerase
MKRVVVTGAAGFIGFHVARALVARGDRVVGTDNLSPYYDVGLKRARLAQLAGADGFEFHEIDLADRASMLSLLRGVRPTHVVHLAAQAGVRHSIAKPWDYVESNLVGFMGMLEACRELGVEHMVYASSSSVYGASARLPYSEHDAADHPVSLYAATKRANELLAHSYSHLFRIPLTGLRLFTVYGPWGRPDMAYYTFTDAILAGRPISLHMGGVLRRDFTFIDDVVEGVVRTMDRVPAPDPAWRTDAPDPALSSAPFRLYNIGNHTPVTVRTLVETLERHLGRRALIEVSPMQAGDVEATHARVDDLARDTGFAPATTLDDGIRQFVAWYREYHGVAGA